MLQGPLLTALLAGRVNNFDMIRFIAATFVIISHAYPLASGVKEAEPFFILTNEQLTLGGTGVATFFVISGFLIFQSYDHSPNILVYTKSRLLRIFPAFIVVIFLAVFALGPILTTLSLSAYFSHHQTWLYLTSIFLFPVQFSLPGVFESQWADGINGSLWTIPYEFLCYIFVGVAGLLGILRRRCLLVALFILILYFQIFAFPSHPEVFERFLKYWFHGINPSLLIDLFSAFLAGMILYAYREKVIISHYLALFSAGMLILASQFGGLKICFLIFGSYLILYLAFSPQIRFHNFAKYGDFSYGIYIYAFPVQQIIVYHFGGSMPASWNYWLAFPITLICAILSWYLVEKRALQLKKVILLSKRWQI